MFIRSSELKPQARSMPAGVPVPSLRLSAGSGFNGVARVLPGIEAERPLQDLDVVKALLLD
jgi:hypothetical protein